jgi:hypothetical protein
MTLGSLVRRSVGNAGQGLAGFERLERTPLVLLVS